MNVCTGLTRRVRALTLKLLPLEVPEDSISDPTSRIITPRVINAYIAAAGDFVEAVSILLISSAVSPGSAASRSYRIVSFSRERNLCTMRTSILQTMEKTWEEVRAVTSELTSSDIPRI